MLFLLSPAKTQLEGEQVKKLPADIQTSAPFFSEESGIVARTLCKLSKAELRSLLSISVAVAEVASKRTESFATAKTAPAAFVFDGPAYRALDAPTLTKSQLEYIQQHLTIICGLYGALRPLDEIKNYRIEMSSKLNIDGKKDLYSFWGTKIARFISERAVAACGKQVDRRPIIINAASEEYAAAVFRQTKSLGEARIINIRFPGASVHAKTSRGAIVRYAAMIAAENPDQLKAFSGLTGELRFNGAASTDDEYVFERVSTITKKAELQKQTSFNTAAATEHASFAPTAPFSRQKRKRES